MKAPRKMTKQRRDRQWQTHVYLGEDDYKLLLEIAERESRSVTMQIQHYIRMGLQQAGAKQ